MKILVTGGAGFIGSHLVERLVNDGNEVIVLDILKRGNKIPREIIKNIQLFQVDIRNREKVFELTRGCDIIYHLAAVLGVDIVADNPIETMEVEYEGTKNIMDAAVKYGINKVLYTSTSGVYGKSAIEKAVVEDMHVSPASSYSIAKRFNEICLKSFYQEKQVNSISVRLFNVYGPRQDIRMVIPRFLEQATLNNDITVYGSGRQTRDFTYIDEVIEAFILLSKEMKGAKIINVARGEETSILELAEKIKMITGSMSKISTINSPSERYDFDVDKRIGDSSRLMELTGFKPTIDIDEGLKTLYSLLLSENDLELKIIK